MNKQYKQETIMGYAYSLSRKFHEGQFRRDGFTPYVKHIDHVVKVCESFSGRLNEDEDVETICVAYLHDILEDTEMTEELLRENFSQDIVDAVVAITKVKGESYEDYLKRVKSNSIAKRVKLADIFSNITDDPTANQRKKYLAALEYLTEK